MAKAKKLKCGTCGKKFSMPAHLARHKSATHGAKKKAKKIVKKGRKKAGSKRPGRPPAIATKFGLKDLPLDDLVALIKAAKDEAGRRLSEYRRLLTK